MRFFEFIIELAKNALDYPEKYLRPGHNGSYHDPETPVRNFGHWLITFAKCYEWTGEARFIQKVEELAEYLCSRESRPHGYSFHHRDNPNKDRCNGLVGQAWTFEALAEAGCVLEDERFGQLAEGVFFQHPFDYGLGLWRCLEIDGKELEFDSTFNHQLWFAACSSLIQSKREGEIKKRIERFLACLKTNMTVLEDGLIYHPIEHLLEAHIERKKRHGKEKARRGRLLRILEAVRRDSGREKNRDGEESRKEMRKRLLFKSIGYHSFNMYAFALLKNGLPDHPFWRSKTLDRMTDYMLSEVFENGLENNPFSYPYNPPGFELPYALSSLGQMSRERLLRICSTWVNRQMDRCYNGETRMMDRNTEDPVTHTARIYELTRLDRVLLDAIEIV